MPIVLLSKTLSGDQAHGGETGQQGAHANREPRVPPLGAHLNTLWEWFGMLGFGVQSKATPRPGTRGYAPNLTEIIFGIFW